MPRPLARPVLAFIVPIVSSAACWAPTAIVLHVETDLPCERVTASSVAVVVAGSTTELSEASPSASSSACSSKGDRADIGSLVIVPSGDRSARVAIKAVVGVERPTDACLGDEVQGCIVARRAVSFVAHESLKLAIRLDRACLGVPCGVDETCDRGRCVPLDTCTGEGCDGERGDRDGGIDPEPLVCAQGRADCDGDPQNGCEADLASSAHCGACGNDCGSLGCISGRCEPLTLVGGLDNPRGIAIAGGEVYVGLDLPAPQGAVVRCPLGGCSSADVVSTGHSHPYAFTSDGSSLFWGDEQQGVFRCTAPGCTGAAKVCNEGPQSIVVSGGDVIAASYANAYVARCVPGTLNPMYFALPDAEPTVVARSSDAVFFGVSPASAGRAVGGIDRCPLPAGCGAMLRPPMLSLKPAGVSPNQPTSLAVDDAFVYWTESSSGSVMRVATSLAGAPVVVASGVRTRSVVLDAEHLYWIDQGSSEADGSIHRANKDGSSHVVLADKQRAPSQLALGPDTEKVKRIFWTSRVSPGGQVRFVAR